MTRHGLTALFAAASLLPAILILIAAHSGGDWTFAALVSVTLLVVVADRIVPTLSPGRSVSELLPPVTGIAHFAVLWATVSAIGHNETRTPLENVALFLAAGLFFGQISNACAHELIHRKSRLARRLGAAIYASLLNGHHVSAHLLVHHVYAATPKDPNSAAAGESFWRFLPRAMISEFRAGWLAESKRRCPGRVHPYVWWISGAVLSLVTSAALSGPAGVFGLVALSLYAQTQLLLSDYIQHYGLRRACGPDGRYEPAGPGHSWNAPQPWSAAMMMNAPLHSDHHLNPQRSFDRLRLDPSVMPVLPRSVPVMGAVALVPPLWHRMMDPRLNRLQGATEPSDKITSNSSVNLLNV